MRKGIWGSGDTARRIAFSLAVSVALAGQASALDKKEYKVFVVVDVLKPKFQEVIDGFRETLDRLLSASSATAVYSIFDTKTEPSTVPAILEAIRADRPDLICAINSPDAFADRNISLRLSNPAFRIVSMNCIPIQSGVAREWEKPGGNISGVGVFVQMSSLLKMAKMIDPKAKKLIFFSWDKMIEINDWFATELKAACKQEGIELSELKYLSSAEDEFDFLLKCDRRGEGYIGIGGISAWVHRDGSYADMIVEEAPLIRNRIKHFPLYTYDEAAVQLGYPAGTCVVWHDLGAQLGEKGMKILQGAKPGDLAWDYPRKYNIMLNLAAAKSIGMVFPKTLVSAAYRIYTDYEGDFIGNKD